MSTVIADWQDVQSKTYRLLSGNKIDIDAVSTFSILCTSHGDNGEYQTYVNNKSRVTKDNSPAKANWYCTCPWGRWTNTGRRPHDGPDSYGSVKVNNRFCSHAYAAYLMLQQYRKLHADEMKKQKDENMTDADQLDDIKNEVDEPYAADSVDDYDMSEAEDQYDDVSVPETERYEDPDQLESDLNDLVDGTETEQDAQNDQETESE